MVMCISPSPSRARGGQPRYTPFKAALSAGIVALATAASAHGDESSLIVQASGFKNNAGQAVARLFMPGDDVLQRGRWEAKAAIKDGKARAWRFHLTIYSGQELRDLLEKVGFINVKLFGSFDGAAYDQNAQRLIVVARRPA